MSTLDLYQFWALYLADACIMMSSSLADHTATMTSISESFFFG